MSVCCQDKTNDGMLDHTSELDGDLKATLIWMTKIHYIEDLLGVIRRLDGKTDITKNRVGFGNTPHAHTKNKMNMLKYAEKHNLTALMAILDMVAMRNVADWNRQCEYAHLIINSDDDEEIVAKSTDSVEDINGTDPGHVMPTNDARFPLVLAISCRRCQSALSKRVLRHRQSWHSQVWYQRPPLLSFGYPQLCNVLPTQHL
jgi:hypothetical protein